LLGLSRLCPTFLELAIRSIALIYISRTGPSFKRSFLSIIRFPRWRVRAMVAMDEEEEKGQGFVKEIMSSMKK
jgi:hypothetical protein